MGLNSVDGVNKPVYLCSMTQDDDEDNIITVSNCELFIDSGNTACDLLLTYHDASKFNLRVTKNVKVINQAEGKLAVAMTIPQVLVTFAIAGMDGQVTQKSAYLEVWVKLQEVPFHALPKAFRDKLVAERAKDATEKAKDEGIPMICSSLAPATPAKLAATVDEPTKAPVNKPSPVRHAAHGSTNLGKSGAKKLMLKYDYETNVIWFLDDSPTEFPEL